MCGDAPTSVKAPTVGMVQDTVSFSLLSYIKTGNFVIDTLFATLLSSFLYWLMEKLKNLQITLSPYEILLNYHLKTYRSVAITFGKDFYKNHVNYYDEKVDHGFLIESVFFCIGRYDIEESHDLSNNKFNVAYKRCSSGKTVKEDIIKGLNKMLYFPMGTFYYKDFIIRYGEETSVDPKSEYNSYHKNLIIYHPSSIKKIHDFIKDCTCKYADKHYPESSNTSLYYAIKQPDEIWERYEKMKNPDTGNHPNLFHIYDYFPRKGKDDIFFPEKDLLFSKYIEFITDEKKDKFCVLLHGLPGTGKTSLIESFSKEFNLSIISANINDFMTEQELVDFFHNPKLYPFNQNGYESIPLENRLYLFEDFDTGSDIVLDREQFQFKKNSVNNSISYVKSDSSTDCDSEDGEDKTCKKKEKKKKNEKSNLINKEAMISSKLFESKVTIKTLLNTFDGVFRLKKSAIFFTTNHIDCIDPALIRPGRINYKIHLKEIEYDLAVQLIAHVNPQIDTKDQVLCKLLQNIKILPCQLEQFCNISKDTTELITHLKSHKTENHTAEHHKAKQK